MPIPTLAHADLTADEIAEADDIHITAVWTCNAKENAGSPENHVMDTATVESIDELTSTYTVEHLDKCMDCQAHHVSVEGSLESATVERETDDGQTEKLADIPVTKLVHEYGMPDGYAQVPEPAAA